MRTPPAQNAPGGHGTLAARTDCAPGGGAAAAAAARAAAVASALPAVAAAAASAAAASAARVGATRAPPRLTM